MSRDYKSRQSSASADSKGNLMLGIFIGFTLGIVSAIGIWFYLENAPSPFINEQQSVASDMANEKEKVVEKTDSKTGETDSKPENEDTTVATAEPRTRFDFYDILSSEGTDVMDYEAPQQIEKPRSVEKPQPIEKPQEVARLQPQPEIPRQTAPQVQPQPEPQLMISPSPPAMPQSRPSNPVATENYYLQVGSFRSHAEADNLKARLAFLGMIASVQSVDLAERGVWYRVRVGPFMQKTQVDTVHVTLRENGIDAQLIKTR
ncbi:MAG: SPOR domain-containing protein [Nitrosomonas sp.]|nr:SPOR domain-containing protein [Nitrosomonas sp.]